MNPLSRFFVLLSFTLALSVALLSPQLPSFHVYSSPPVSFRDSLCEAAESQSHQGVHPEAKHTADLSRQPRVAPPPEAYAAFCKGLTHKFRGDFESAVEEFLKANERYPQSPTIHLNLAICYKRLNRKDEMLAHLKALSELKPDDLEIHLMLAKSLRLSKMYEEALEEYEKVWRSDEGKVMSADKVFQVLVSPYLKIAEAYKQGAKFMAAISTYDKLLRHISGLPGIGLRTMPFRLEIGQLYQKAGKHARALNCYNTLLRDIDELNDPSDSGIRRDFLRLRIAQLYDEMGQEEKAIECYIALLSDIEKLSNPADSDIKPDVLRLELGFIYSESEQIQKAMDCYNGIISHARDKHKTMRMDPRDRKIRIIAYIRIASLRAGERRYAEAAKTLQCALDENLDDARIYSFLGDILKRNKHYDEALTTLKRGVSHFPNDRDIHFTLASLYDEWNMDDKAEKALKKTLEIDPTFPDANNYLGYFYAEKGINLDDAIRLVNRALKEMPHNGAYLDSLGWAYYKQALLMHESDSEDRQKKITLALEKLEQAVEQMDDPVIREHLGDVYHTMGQLEKAKAEWGKALSLWAEEANSDLPPGPEGVKKKLENLKKVENKKTRAATNKH